MGLDFFAAGDAGFDQERNMSSVGVVDKTLLPPGQEDRLKELDLRIGDADGLTVFVAPKTRGQHCAQPESPSIHWSTAAS